MLDWWLAHHIRARSSATPIVRRAVAVTRGQGPAAVSRLVGRSVGYSGPDQSKPMCLLERPVRSHLNPNASALSAVAVPYVATPPGPVSEPSALCTCTRLPGGVVGPPSASALDFNLPGISARHDAKSSST